MNNTLIQRRHLMQSLSILPAEYTLAKYIETSGDLYIDLQLFYAGELQNADPYNTISFQMLSIDNNPYIYGGADGSNFSIYYFARISGNQLQLGHAGGLSLKSPSIGEWHTLQTNFLEGSKLYNANGDIVATSGKATTAWFLSINRTVYLFARHGKGDVGYNASRMRIQHARFANLNHTTGKINVLRDLYPCYRKLDNKPGMYDIKNNIFYTNKGSGEFILGF